MLWYTVDSTLYVVSCSGDGYFMKRSMSSARIPINDGTVISYFEVP